MESGKLIDCNKYSLTSDCKQFDATSSLADFKFIDSGSEHLFRTCSVASSLVTSLLLLQCCGGYGVIPDSLLNWAETTITTSEYAIVPKPLVATRTNEE